MRRREMLGGLLPASVGRPLGFVHRSKIDVIFDASGYAYSEKFGMHPIESTLRKYTRFADAGGRIVMLPQSFGPFDSEQGRRRMKVLAETAERIYARDHISLAALRQVAPVGTLIEPAPDMTILLQGRVDETIPVDERSVAIVPNKRMVDQLQGEKPYLDFLSGTIRWLIRNHLRPYFLIFGGREDLEIAARLNVGFKTPLPIVDSADPLTLKGIISRSGAVIGSRYHALASALFTNTICFGMGWSHKYNTLFEEYNLGECLLDVFDRREHRKIAVLTDPLWRAKTVQRMQTTNSEKILSAKAVFAAVKESIFS